jgi:hypothetical protein
MVLEDLSIRRALPQDATALVWTGYLASVRPILLKNAVSPKRFVVLSLLVALLTHQDGIDKFVGLNYRPEFTVGRITRISSSVLFGIRWTVGCSAKGSGLRSILMGMSALVG